MHVDMRAWQAVAATEVPQDQTLTVLASDPFTGNVWIGWHSEEGVALRAMVHESDLDYAAPAERTKKVQLD